jgi:hypothetical protein
MRAHEFVPTIIVTGDDSYEILVPSFSALDTWLHSSTPYNMMVALQEISPSGNLTVLFKSTICEKVYCAAPRLKEKIQFKFV